MQESASAVAAAVSDGLMGNGAAGNGLADDGATARRAVLFVAGGGPPGRWGDALRACIPDLELRVWPDIGDPAEIDVLVIWKQKPPPGLVETLPNVRGALVLGAGVDYLMDEPHLLRGLPVGRLIDPRQVRGLTEYIVLATLRTHRDFPAFDRAKARAEWDYRHPIDPAERRVGFMGFGNMVREGAEILQRLGFPIAIWTRRERHEAGIACFHGEAGLDAFLGQTDILILGLPLTPETRFILNARRLALLPKGAAIVNIGRGHLIDEPALLEALDRAHVSEATLDVFQQEPLPPEHPFWVHPRVMITTHIAGVPRPSSAAPQLAEDIRRLRRGELPKHVVDAAAGY